MEKNPQAPPSPAASLRKLRRRLYPLYSRGSAANHFFRRRFRPPGVGLLLATVAVSAIGAGQNSEPVYRLLSFCVSLLALALVLLPFRRARVAVSRELPPHATAGRPTPLHLNVRNLRARPLRRAWIGEIPPDPRPRLATFLSAIEPGVQERNAFDRLFSYDCWTWLCERATPFDAETAEPVLDLAPGESARRTVMLTPRRRGILELHHVELVLPDPLGLFQRRLAVKTEPARLTVLPRRFRLPTVELPGTARLQPGGDVTARQAGPSGEFVGLRDYVPGDPLRLIHWPSWARTGRPIVKELEDAFFPRHGLLLDTHPDELDEELFEAAVSVAASFVAAVDTRECLIELMFIAGREHVLTAGRGTARITPLLEALATVEASPEPQLRPLHRLVLRHGEDLAGCLAILPGWTAHQRDFLHQLRASGVETAAIAVCHSPPEKPAPQVHFVRPSHLAEDLLKLPSRL